MPPKQKKPDRLEVASEFQGDELDDFLRFAWLCSNSNDDIAHPIRFESVIKFDA